ncbi:MAG TPA: phosphate acyltransferase PlsX, partial [Burkholderiaceae bacterium]|nr:phosphate acyltransferase PlsX [Burkholderiaceae bacterium]
ELILVGDLARLRRAVGAAGERVSLRHAGQTLAPGDNLSAVLRRKPDSSMRQALLCHAAGEADAVVSAGDTAALMALARATLAMVPGIDRPAIGKELDGMSGRFWMLDLGANVSCTATQLAQFGRMGATLARHVGGVAEPRVALLNIGTEAAKGPAVLSEAARLLERAPGMRYAGFVEGNALFSGVADVVVSDGFAGNVALKSIEGAARMARHLLDQWLAQAGDSAIAAAGVETLRHAFDPQRYNGASFVGLAGVVIKSHGSANVEGFKRAIEEAVLEVEGRIPARLAAELG